MVISYWVIERTIERCLGNQSSTVRGVDCDHEKNPFCQADSVNYGRCLLYMTRRLLHNCTNCINHLRNINDVIRD